VDRGEAQAEHEIVVLRDSGHQARLQHPARIGVEAEHATRAQIVQVRGHEVDRRLVAIRGQDRADAVDAQARRVAPRLHLIEQRVLHVEDLIEVGRVAHPRAPSALPAASLGVRPAVKTERSCAPAGASTGAIEITR